MKSRRIREGRRYVYRDAYEHTSVVTVLATGVEITALASGRPTPEGVVIEHDSGARELVLARHIIAPAENANPPADANLPADDDEEART